MLTITVVYTRTLTPTVRICQYPPLAGHIGNTELRTLTSASSTYCMRVRWARNWCGIKDIRQSKSIAQSKGHAPFLDIQIPVSDLFGCWECVEVLMGSICQGHWC